jgi:hypothetical protein
LFHQIGVIVMPSIYFPLFQSLPWESLIHTEMLRFTNNIRHVYTFTDCFRQNLSLFPGTDLPWVRGRGGGMRALRLVMSSTRLEKSSTTLKNLHDDTFSAFRIAISGTFTVSACRFLETIYLICAWAYQKILRMLQLNIMVKYVNMFFNKQIYCTVLQQLSNHTYVIKSRYKLYGKI